LLLKLLRFLHALNCSLSSIHLIKGVRTKDLLESILVDQPEGLPVPGISNPISSVSLFNQDSKKWLEPIFYFADQHLHDDGAFIILHPFRLSTKSNILGYCKSYGFEICKEWWGMNRLHLTSAVHSTSTISDLILKCICFHLSYICYCFRL
jgi:hypothetical protein